MLISFKFLSLPSMMAVGEYLEQLEHFAAFIRAI